MTGPKHYREAERLLLPKARSAPPDERAVARAQVHATLALAAAVATTDNSLRSDADSRARYDVLNPGGAS